MAEKLTEVKAGDFTLTIGGDVGDLVYCYGKGKDGVGIYRTEEGSLCLDEMADKIADTLTDFLVKGVGIDTALTL